MKYFISLLSLLFLLPSVTAQELTLQNAEVGQARLLGNTGNIRDKIPFHPYNISAKKKALRQDYPKAPLNFKGQFAQRNNNPDALPLGDDPLRQAGPNFNDLSAVFPMLNFDGIDVTQAAGATVPDANGDLSPDFYFQITNGGGSVFQIFDKEGILQYGPASLNTFWEPFNLTGLGDPIVLWDQSAKRWLVTELGTFGTNVMLIAVSMTDDPLGDYFIYEFQAPELPDYPKYGIWPNAYFITTNEGGDLNMPVYALDREAMLVGEPQIQIQRLGFPKFNTNGGFAFQTATPVDWDGRYNMPEAGTPHYVLRMYDDAWDGGEDKLELWEIDIDWDDANNSSVSGPIELITTPFDSDVCNGSLFDCLDQPNGEPVSAMMQVIMHRANYRNFGTHESIVLNHTVDVDGNNLAGVRWYELRKPNDGQWNIHQEGTIGGGEDHRFMGSIAIDAGGNIGLGYSIVGPDKFLSLAYTGRKMDDPLNIMTVEEYEFASGLSIHPGFRWGDYAMMTVDELNGNTFWFTGEYMKADSLWGTKIVSFQINRSDNDVGPFELLQPQSGAGFSDMEQVIVGVKNFGVLPQSEFNVGLLVNDVFVDEAMVLDTVAPDSIVYLTFDNVLDMSSLGEYKFQIYTDLYEDENILNDTIRLSRLVLPRLDASIYNVIGIENTVCESTINVGFELKNEGVDTLIAAVISWSLNNGTLQSMNWTGSLPMGKKDTIEATLSGIQNGLNPLVVSVDLPNGETDEVMINDVLQRSIFGALDQETIQLELLVDLYPIETNWQVTDENGNIIFSGGPYTVPETTFFEDWCLPEGCYTFTIFDTFGDGMSFSGVEGSYQITDDEGHILAQIMNPSFGSMESNAFCSPFVCTVSGESTTMIESSEGAEDGAIHLEVFNGLGPFEYSIDGGVTFQESPIFTDLAGDEYSVVITDLNACSWESIVTVETCNLVFSVLLTNATGGLNNGSIQVNPQNGLAPFEYSIDTLGNFQTSSVFSGLGLGSYVIYVQDANGCVYEREVSLGTSTATEQFFEPHIELMPNPTEGVFRINVLGVLSQNTLEVDLLDSSGKVIQRSRLVRYDDRLTGQLSLLRFPAGVYFVRLKDLNRLEKIVRN